jgi:hypothetical protein
MRSLPLIVAILLSTITACVATMSGPAAPAEHHAMRNGYTYLGERMVMGSGQAVHEAIGGLKHDGRFTSVMLVIEDAPVQMDDVVFTFGDGQQFRPGTRLEFGPNSTTREIPLPGGNRMIQRVDFVFNNFPGNGRAKVELWAR